MDLEGFERGARMLFSFPSLKASIIAAAVAFIAALYLRCSLAYLVHVTFVLPAILKLSARRLITMKRAIGLVPIFLAWGSLATLLRGYTPLLLLPPSLLLVPVTRFLSGSRRWGPAIALCTVIVMGLEGGSTNMLTLASIASVASLVSVEAYSRKLEGRLSEFGGLSVLDAYLSYALEGRKEPLEEVLTNLSAERCIPVYALDLVEGERVWGSMVVPHVHPGPFKDFGSSRLPSMLAKAAAERGISCVVFHGASTHSEDLVRESDARRLAEMILAGEGETVCTGSLLGLAEHSNFTHRAVALALEGGWALVFVERLDGGMEDVPFDLAGAVGPGAVLIDGHNSFDEPRPSPSPQSPLGKSVIDCATTALRSACLNIRSGWRVIVSQRLGTMGAELGSAGVAVAWIEHESGTKLLLASFDANNMKRSLRDELYAKLKSFHATVFVATTDTHELTGARPGTTYEPLGERYGANMYTSIIEDLLAHAGPAKELRYKLRVLTFRSIFLDPIKVQKLGAMIDSLLTHALALLAAHFSLFLLPLLVF